MHEGEVTPEDRPFVVSTLRVKRKKEKKKKKVERKEGVWSKRRVSFRTSLMRNNNVAYTSTPSGCRLYPLYSSGVFFFFEYSSPSIHGHLHTLLLCFSYWSEWKELHANSENPCLAGKLKKREKFRCLFRSPFHTVVSKRQNDETSNNTNCSIRFSI